MYESTQNIYLYVFMCNGKENDYSETLLVKRQYLITKTRLYNFDPLKPHFYICKTGVYKGIHYLFLISDQNIDCGYSLEPPRRGGSNEYPQSMF